MSTCNFITLINGTDCIGDTRNTINQNFANLDNVVCALSSSAVNGCTTPTVDVSYQSTSRTICATVRNSSIDTVHLADSSVKTSKINDSSVTNSKLAFDGGTLGYRNKIINGALNIWQRSTVFLDANGYTADRFAVTRSGSFIGVAGATGVTVTQDLDTPPTGDTFLYSLKVQRDPGDTNSNDIKILYACETADILECIDRDVTLSFYIKTGTTFTSTNLTAFLHTGQTIDGSINGMHTNSWSGQIDSPGPIAPSVPGVWQFISTTFTVPPNSRQIGISFQFTPQPGVAGGDESVYITGIQLETGNTVTAYEHRPISHELTMCQRYFENGSSYIDANHLTADLFWRIPIYYKVTKRTSTPIITRVAGALASASGFTHLVNENTAVISVQVPLPGTEHSIEYTVDGEL